jgi:peptidoglycan/LPS O-acetylase OafA/YrhL
MTTTPVTTGAPIRTEAVRWQYRPHLDGVRAVAVLLVVLFHAEAPGFGGGFIGVDVFFVLSGFVVTGSLLAEHARTGRIALPSFYARRVRRLLPAATVLLLSLVVGMRVLASPFERLQAAGDLAAASLYSANWWFVAQASDYFGTDAAESPVLHFWSLAVEEQFYVVWPLVLLLLLPGAVGRHRGRVMVVVGVVATVSLALAVTTPDTSLLTAYYGTHTRVYQLFAGALLAVVAVDGRLRWVPRRIGPPGQWSH